MSPVAEKAQLDYAEVRNLVRETVEGAVPPGATVAVISKGDDALVRFDGPHGWHFPRTATGEYAGHYPEDTAAVVAHLEDVRAGGAQYFAIPTTYEWWLDHYVGLAEYLETNHQLVAGSRESCLVYSLIGDFGAATASSDDEAPATRLQRFLGILLPEDARFVLVTGGDADEASVGESETWSIATDVIASDTRRIDAELAAMEERLAGQVDYVVIPRSIAAHSGRSNRLIERARRRWRLLTEQEHMVTVFALSR
jgi:hypothetical protein